MLSLIFAAHAALTCDDVTGLIAVRLPESAIIETIRDQGVRRDALACLEAAQIPPAVLDAARGAAVEAPPPATPAPAPAPALPRPLPQTPAQRAPAPAPTQYECTTLPVWHSGGLLPREDARDVTNWRTTKLPPGWKPISAGMYPVGNSFQFAVLICREY